MKRWFISYWPYYAARPASTIETTNDIEKTIGLIQQGKLRTFGPSGTVIFFHQLPEVKL